MAPILEKDQINDLVTLIQTRFLQLEFDFLRFIFTSENLEIFFIIIILSWSNAVQEIT